MANIDFWNLLGKKEDNTPLLSPLKKDTPISEDGNIDEGLNIENPQAGNSQLPVVGKIPAQKLGAYDTKANEEAVRQKYFQGKKGVVIPAVEMSDELMAQQGESSYDTNTDVNASTDVPTKEVSTADKYKQMLEELEAIRSEPKKDLTPLRAGNQMAQAFAAKYGGKLNNNNDVVTMLEEGGRKQRYSELLNQLKVMKELDGQGQKNPWQLRTLNDNGVIKQFRINTLTGETQAIGEAGFALDNYTNKETGERTTGSRSNINVPNIVKPTNLNNPVVKDFYKISDIQGKPEVYTNTILPKIDEFKKDMKDNRDVATSITNLNHKVGVGINNQKLIDSGYLGGIQTQAAKMAGQKGVLTDQDLAKFGGAGGLAAWGNRFLSGALGDMTEKDVEFFREFSRIMSDAAREDISNKAQFQADQIRQGVEKYLPGFTNENALEWLSASKIAPVIQTPNPNNIVSLQLPDGRVVKVTQEKAEKYLKDSRYKIVK